MNAPEIRYPLISPREAAAYTAPFEGCRLVAYHDNAARRDDGSTGVLTVGYGFNLERDDAGQLLSQAGIDYILAVNRTPITQDQANRLLQATLLISFADAAQLFGELQQYPADVQRILVDLAFQLGRPRLAKFKGFIRAIRARRWALAAGELIFRDIGKPDTTALFNLPEKRCETHASLLLLIEKRDMEAAA